MLEYLHVKNLALIEECEIEFTKGLNILTGETGAGKSVLLGSVNLALGQKGDKELIREGEEEAFVELVFSAPKSTLLQLEKMEITCDDESVSISRKISKTKSVFKINGETVNSKQVKEIARGLIDIHGQHEHQSLLNVVRQRELIDSFKQETVEKLLEKVSFLYKSIKENDKEIAELAPLSRTRDREIDLLEYEINEIDEANLIPGEDVELEENYRRMKSSLKLTENLNEAVACISGEGNACAGEFVSRAISRVSSMADIDSEASKMLDKLTTCEDLLGDFSLLASRYMDRLSFEPEEFSKVEERLDLINTLKSKFGRTIEDILEYKEQKNKELENLRNLDARLAELTKASGVLMDEYHEWADKLSSARKESGRLFSKELTKALSELAFNDVDFEVAFTVKNDISESGLDDVEFMISTNTGEPKRPLRNVASGGELSRVMLAIKTIIAKEDSIDSLIFDEIDSGISGKTAWEVSKKLADLSREHQVICITHLAQIAAMSDTHFEIKKELVNSRMATSISLLSKDGEIDELARLLGTENTSDAAKCNAIELKTSADNWKREL